MGSFSAQISFHKVFAGTGYDYGYGIDELEDSSYIVTGATSSFNNGSQAYLLKLDKYGNKQWSLDYGGPESEEGRRVFYVENVGYYICGTTNSYGNGAYDYYLLKTDLNGNLQWETTFGDFGWEKIHDAALTRDTGLILVGETSSNATDNTDIYIVRTDKDGNMLWDLILGESGDDKATSIKAYNDSSFAIGGHFYVADSLYTKGVIYRLMDNGVLIDTTYLGDNGNYGVNDVEFAGGEIEAVGFNNGPISDGDDQHAWEIDTTTMTVVHEWIPVYPEGAITYAITAYGDSTRRYMAHNFWGPSTFGGGPDLAIVNFTHNIFWIGNGPLISDDGLDLIGDLKGTLDGGAVAVGSTAGPGAGVSTIFVTKIGPGEDYPSTDSPIVYDLVETIELGHGHLVEVYPNPAADFLKVDIGDLNNGRYEIMDISGGIVGEGDLSVTNQISLDEFGNGMYFIQMVFNNGTSAVVRFEVSH